MADDAAVARQDEDPYGLVAFRQSLDGLSKRQLLEEYGRTEAFAGVFSMRSAAIRDVAKGKALAELDEQGVKSGWEAPGVASLTVTMPSEDKLAVKDRAALGSWTAQHFPTEAFASFEVEAPDLPRALEVLEQAGIVVRKATVEPRDAFVKNVLTKLDTKGRPKTVEVIRLPKVDEAGEPVLDDDGKQLVEVSVHMLKDGTLVDGLGLADPGQPNVMIRVDARAKAQAQAEVQTAAVRAMGAPPVPAQRAAPFGTALAAVDPQPEVEEAGDPFEEAGEPYDPPCASKVQGGTCGVPESEHGGAQHRGGYRPTGCKRFRERLAA